MNVSFGTLVNFSRNACNFCPGFGRSRHSGMTLGRSLIIVPNRQDATKWSTLEDIMDLNLSWQEKKEVGTNVDTEFQCIADTFRDFASFKARLQDM